MKTPSPANVRGAAPDAQQQTPRPAAPSTEQVETIVRHLAKVYLEVERGLRPPHHLEPHLTSDAYDRLRRRPRQTFARGGPVGSRDLGPVTSTTYPSTMRVFASLTAREQGDRWSGLLLQLRHLEGGRLVIAELQRVPQRPHTRHTESRREPSLYEQIRWVQDEHDLVEAALLAERERPPTRPADTSRTPARVAFAKAHAARLPELLHELAMLHAQERSRQAVKAHAHIIEPAPPDYITKLIGPRPNDGWHRLQWDSAHTAIEDYRRRYDVHDTTALGPNSADQGQSRDRDQLAALLRSVQTRLPRSRTHGQQLELKPKDRDRAARDARETLQDRALHPGNLR